MTEKPGWSQIWYECMYCEHAWNDWQPTDVPITTWLKHVHSHACPECGLGIEDIKIRNYPLTDHDQWFHLECRLKILNIDPRDIVVITTKSPVTNIQLKYLHETLWPFMQRNGYTNPVVFMSEGADIRTVRLTKEQWEQERELYQNREKENGFV